MPCDDRSEPVVGAVLVEASDRTAEAGVAGGQRCDQRNRRLALDEIVGDRFAERAFVGRDVEQVVFHLKRDAERVAEGVERGDLRRVTAAHDRAAACRRREEGGRLLASDLDVHLQREVEIAERLKLQHFAVADRRPA